MTPSNQMDLDQDIKVINPKTQNVSPEERHKWMIPELEPATKTRVGSSSIPLDRDNKHLSLRKGESLGPEKSEYHLKGWTPISCKGKVKQIQAWLKNQIMLSENQKKQLFPKKEKIPVEAPQASKSKNTPQQAPKKGKKAPKRNTKGKAKPKWKKSYAQSYRIPKREKTAINNLFNMARALMELKNKEEERIN
ncbi:hypothetical protein O181_020227 [Austropuccinia psidii MF-1]|uniref:Uncharacterized protein n=1 Tax=Austropuccinia psidii MF-1 TaxID=1389203 RepID=A0A9Q3CD28_9BASI|nr:hypothetical protein [Austropuccinia psidii MF-1]